MNTRTLRAREQANLGVLREAGLDVAILFVTPTGLKKAILDATIPLRTLLSQHGIHDFSSQGQGRTEHGVTIEIQIVEDDAIYPVSTSFYRPETKKGDPRFWPSRFNMYAGADDVFAMFVYSTRLYLLNLSSSKIAADRAMGRTSEALHFITDVGRNESAVADELLGLLRNIARRGLLKAVGSGSGAVGLSIENALGIAANPNRQPDYRGIELKAARGTVLRSQLFAQVPDWTLSPCKSSLAILQKCGYIRSGRLQLYCEVRTTKRNSQGLRLQVREIPPWLVEYLDRKPPEDVAVWPLELLHRRLLEKHRETFWIKAPSIMIDNVEHFALKSVMHTRRPSFAQFDQLLLEGAISVDHLCRMKGSSAAERGPLFKIDEARRAELFTGPPRHFRLDG